MEPQQSSHNAQPASSFQERRGGQLSMLTLPSGNVQALCSVDHPPPARQNTQPQLLGHHSIYSNEESNASFFSNALSSDQVPASKLYGMRSNSPFERPSNPLPCQQESTKPQYTSLHIPHIQNSTTTYFNDMNGASIQRQRSLTRPERQRPRPSMVTGIPTALSAEKMSGEPTSTSLHSAAGEVNHRRAITSNSGKLRVPLGAIDQGDESQYKPGFSFFFQFSWWVIASRIATCCFPGWCLRICLKKQSKMVQQAWREKAMYIIMFCCGVLAFLTFGLRNTICGDILTDSYTFTNETTGQRERVYREDVVVHGRLYPYDIMKSFLATQNITMTTDYKNMDITALFDTDVTGACTTYDAGRGYGQGTMGNCIVPGPYGGTLQRGDSNCISLKTLRKYYKSKRLLVYDWKDVQPNGPSAHPVNPPNITVLGDSVLNLTYYMSKGKAFFGNRTHLLLKQARAQDASYMFASWNEVKQAEPCLVARYYSGAISSDTMGCIISQLITTLMFSIIIGLVAVRFSMAAVFHWFVAPRLPKSGGRSGKILSWRSVAGGNNDPAMRKAPATLQSTADLTPTWYSKPERTSIAASDSTMVEPDIVNTQLYTIMLVTCYSEGEPSLRKALDSLARTTYSNRHKVFFIVADGMITGSGNTKSTPDILLSMLTLSSSMEEPKKCTYMAIAEGGKQLNIAKVYAGHYRCDDQMHPTILVIKCGTDAEQSSPKPGNRGKRDSQLILMSFLQRVLFNDRLSELDYEIFWKLCWIMKGVTPDKFELVLMVDADTMVADDSLTHMVAAMANDITIMGLCGETRIANKTDSWVTMIQVFEYYISHHYAKAFESVFGGVTCLPGCFCMYRVKAPKNGAWVPLLANPDIVLEYNQNVVTTLHAKNLLFLGEDRFLSTLMLRTFPKRQMIFIPQAVCKTVVPETFHVLLSQRRRWINSTIHNLMELVLVSDLCGIACLSMQFVVFMDLLGTAILPAAVALAVYVIVSSAMADQPQILPITVLVAILGLPAVLIVLTTRKVSMFGWMVIYILALPIWNFVLPVYAFWHFDDFTWGHTRRVNGDKANEGHTEEDGDFDGSQVVMRKWEEWECLRSGRRKSPTRMTLITPSNASTIDEEKRSAPVSPLSPTFLDRQRFGSTSPTPSIRGGIEKENRRLSVPVYFTASNNRSREFRRPSSPTSVDARKRRASNEIGASRQGRPKSDGYLGQQPKVASMVSLSPHSHGTESSETVGSLSIKSSNSKRPSETTNGTALASDGASNGNESGPSDPVYTSDIETSLQQVLKQYR